MDSYNVAGRVTGQRLSAQLPGGLAPADLLDASYGWDNEGRMTSQAYPVPAFNNTTDTLTLGYHYDSMGRLGTMTGDLGDGNGALQYANASYGPAGELTGLTGVYPGPLYPFPFDETRTYNSLSQLTGINDSVYGNGSSVNMQYVYSATQNNGRIAQSNDGVTGQQVTYQYDSLNRLVHAETADSAWGETYQYDRFGNLTVKTPTKGSAPALSAMYDAATNRQMGVQYDANGNQLVGTWDVENRLVSENAPDGSTPQWLYDPWGKRVGKGSTDGNGNAIYEFTLYGITGQRLATVGCYSDYPMCRTARSNVYFSGRFLGHRDWGGITGAVGVDRLGSVRQWGLSYWPYGEEEGTPTAGGQEKFATYFRDWVGQDYADQRYYSSNTGSFWTPDPLGASAADPTDPNSWNMYAYAGGDPINFNDPDGTTACGDLQILGTGSSLSSAVTGGGDTALLADLVWAESDHTWSRQASQAYYNEQDAVAWTVENRWKILNGYLSVAGVSNPSTLGWGPNGASISQIIGWSSPTQFSTISGGQLRSDLQSTLNSVLAGSPTAGDVLNLNLGNLGVVSMTHECFDVWQSYVAASFALNGTSSDPFASQGYTTSFHHGTNTTSLEGYFGSFGDANNFFGIAKGSVTVNPTPVLPRPRPRPIRPPGRGGRRGPL